MEEKDLSKYHDCGGCDGRGHHPTRTDLLCQMCDGTGKGPYLKGVCDECGGPAPVGLYECEPCHRRSREVNDV